MAGRTHLRHALPCTFGYKGAVYLSGLVRHAERLTEIEQRCLLVQFGGVAGTLASLGDDDTGQRVRAQLAVELGLRDPPITWHVVRDNIAEIFNSLALVGGSLGRIAYDIIIMSSNELGEVSEPFVPHRGASSTMPQKRNPISIEVVLAAYKLLRTNTSLQLDAMVVDFERASGPWHLEWLAISEAFALVVGSPHQTNFALSGLVVNTDSMYRVLCSTKGLIVGEAIMMGLAPFVGRQPAHDFVYEACKTAIENSKPLLDVLASNEQVTAKVSKQQLDYFCGPLNYLGASQAMVDDVLRTSALIRRGTKKSEEINDTLRPPTGPGVTETFSFRAASGFHTVIFCGPKKPDAYSSYRLLIYLSSARSFAPSRSESAMGEAFGQTYSPFLDSNLQNVGSGQSYSPFSGSKVQIGGSGDVVSDGENPAALISRCIKGRSWRCLHVLVFLVSSAQ